MFAKARLELISTLLENAGWERCWVDGEIAFKTPKDYNLEYWQKGSYKIWDAIHIQTMLDMKMVENEKSSSL